jgi:uncharacterized protein YdaU (DUF1376 family)
VHYYEHHIGDYAEATAHLSFIEDAAYSRLIRKYYATEKPLPADIKAVQRLVGARTKEEKKSVEVVLSEFFFLADDGWHNSRCDAEILNFLDGEPEREVKKANEENRLKRHREERANLFKRLTDAGLHAAWNIGMKELRELVAGIPNTTPATPPATLFDKPATAPATAPATPATATQTPYTVHQSPVLKTEEQAASTAQPLPHDEPTHAAAFDPIVSRSIELVALLKRGASLQASNPIVRAWAESGVTDAQALTALEIAEQRRADQGNPQAINAGFLNTILGDVVTPRARASPPARNTREARISNYAAEAAQARGEHENEHSNGRTERDITGESIRVA